MCDHTERFKQLAASGANADSVELVQRLLSAIEHECGEDYALFGQTDDEGILVEGDRKDGRPFVISVWVGTAEGFSTRSET